MLFLVGLLGWGAGGVINLLADQLPITRRIGRPTCEACTAPRPPQAWLGWLALLSHSWCCPYCGTPRRKRTLAVELAVTAAAIYLYSTPSQGISLVGDAFIAALFTLILVIDIEHRLILHVVTLPSACLLLLLGVLDPSLGFLKTVIGGLAGLGLTLLFYLLGELFARISARRRGAPLDEVAFGFGDVTLAGVIGLSVGWSGILIALLAGVLLAGEFSLVFLLWMFLRRRYEAYAPFPYGPFLISGGVLVRYGGAHGVEAFFPAGLLWSLGFFSTSFLLADFYQQVRSRS